MEKWLPGQCESTGIVVTCLEPPKHILTDVQKNKCDFQLSLGGTPLLNTLGKRRKQHIPIKRFSQWDVKNIHTGLFKEFSMFLEVNAKN